VSEAGRSTGQQSQTEQSIANQELRRILLRPFISTKGDQSPGASFARGEMFESLALHRVASFGTLHPGFAREQGIAGESIICLTDYLEIG
jgi:hypothetical protein